MTPRVVITGAALAAVLAVSGCANAAYKDRMDYLRTAAQRGADTHALLDAQGATIDKSRCVAAFAGLDTGDEPSVSDGGAYAEQVQQFFVDSCVSGRPRPLPDQAVPPSPTGGSPTPTVSS